MENSDLSFRKTCLTHPYIPPAEIDDGAGAAVIANEDKLWENGSEITYAFMPPFSGAPQEQAKVHTIVQEWSLFANLAFTHVKSPADAMIRISFNQSPKTGSWSYVGKDCLNEEIIAKNKPTMNLGFLDPSKNVTKNDRGLVLHEFGHAIGLLHEHQSPAMVGVLKIKEDATIEAFTKGDGPNKWTREEILTQMINPINNGEYTNFTSLDVKSVMMYFMPADMNEQNLDIPPNNELSDYDKAFVLVHYPIFDFSDRTDGWDFEKALTVLGIEGEGRATVLEMYAAFNVTGIRQEFAKAYASVREARNAETAKKIVENIM